MRHAALVGVLLLVLLVPLAAGAQVEHVVLVFLDGPRYSETFGDPGRIPRIWDELRPAGAILREYRNGGFTQTVPGHSSTTTGFWQWIANDGSERPHDPTLFERLRKAQGLPAGSGWVVAGKAKLDVLAHSDHPDFGAAYAARDTVGLGGDAATVAALLPVLVDWRPRLTVVNLPSIDVAGHSGVWEDYLAAISAADALVGNLWDAIQAHPQMAGHTVLLVTADHGRHDNRPDLPHDGFTGHGDDCHGCQHILFLALGPGIRAGHESAIPRTQLDAAATVAVLLGLDPDPLDGRPMWELFEDPPVALVPSPPRDLLLVEAYPNPFNPAADIRVESPGRSWATLAIYDLRGRHVRTLYQGTLPEGELRMRWEGRDDAGRPVASGVYHLRLLAGECSRTLPLTLVR